ncbi:hypothetical protein [Longimicrobium sp.]|uniref:hypothetical protein n=1 Tax=Longimicrobium sp. TaxID=2029185 RepID=UPI002E32195A|nr:hypothetical protein [Longimicrobium sp.]HEX6041649.1 hypothetical protein [Longimicrobium sp.]
MKRTLLAALALAALLPAAPAAAQQTETLPFKISWQPVSIPNLPALQSFARATDSQGRWLLLTGRRAGLHGFSAPPTNNFPPTEMNDSIYVVDPSARQVWSMPVSIFPDSVADLLRVTNAQSVQNGNTLYVIGGYGMNSSTGRMMTFPTLMAINIPAAVTAVTSKDAAGLSEAITWSHDWRLAVTGGELQRLGSTYYLIFGQQFDGLYDPNDSNIGVTFTQRYTEQIARFTLTTTSSGRPAVGTYYAPYTSTAPNRPYHRRDLTSAPVISTSGSQGLGIYGGVFAPGNDSTYRQAVYINGAGVAPVLATYTQYMNQYTGAVLPMYSATRGRTMFTTFFGGISLYQVDRTSDPDRLVRNDTVPFVSAVSTLVRRSDGSTFECVWPDSLPGLLGAESALLPAAGVPDFDNGVVQLDRLPPASTLGYFYGGIQAQQPNFGPSTATNLVLELKIAPLPTTCAVATAPPVPQTGAIRRRP